MVEIENDAAERGHGTKVVATVAGTGGDAMLVFDACGDILGVNGEAEQLFGVISADIVGGDIGTLLSMADRARLLGALPATEDGGRGAVLTAVGRRRNGPSFLVNLEIIASAVPYGVYTAMVRVVSEPETTVASTKFGVMATAGRARLLVFESDAAVAGLLRGMLEEAGFVVDVVGDADEARRRIAARHYAALTVDLMLSEEDGLDLVRELRCRPETRDLPVIMISARTERRRDVLGPCQSVAGGAIGLMDWLRDPDDDRRCVEALRHAVDYAGGRHRILHVEDDRDLLRAVAAQLGDIAQVSSAATLGQARLRLASEPFDLVILDVGLTGGAGSDLLDDIKKLVPAVPVLVVSTGKATPHSGTILARALVKSPTSYRDLTNAVRSLVAGAHRLGAAA